MARPIDEKIVKMSLDNADFKKKVSETLTSFNSIDKGINSMDSINLSRMAEGISALERRFSAAGIAIGTIIANITQSAINMGKKLYSAMVGPLVEGGKKRALNIEQAKFQFEGLGMDVEKTMQSALEAVKGTAYGLDEAAVVASQFGATGMRAGEEMTAALRGISGVAAMTGSSYSDVGNIFTTVAGNGRLMGSELLRLSSRGVNAAAVLGKAMGKTEAEIRSMVSKGQISFEMFAEAMNDAFGEHATKANETYTGSLSNLRAALARIGAAIYTPQFENQKHLFNALTPVVDDLADALGPLIEEFNKLSTMSFKSLISFVEGINISKFVELGGMKNIIDSFWNVMNSGITILKAVSEAFSRVFPPATAAGFVRITEIIKNLTSGLTISGSAAEKITTIFQGVFAIFSTVFIIAKQLGQALLNLLPKGLGGGVLSILEGFAKLSIAFNDSVKSGNFLTKTIQLLGKALGSIGGAIGTALGFIGRMTSSLRFDLGGTIDWIREKLSPLAKWFAEAFKGFGTQELVGGAGLVGIALVVKRIMNAIENMGGIFETFRKSIGGFGSLFKGILEEAGGALKAFQEQVKYNNLLKIAIAIGILAVGLKILEGIDSADLSRGIAALSTSLMIMMGGLMVIEKLSLTGGLRASVNLIALATAVTIMATALNKIAGLSTGEMIKGIAGLVGIVTALSLGIIAISKLGGRMAVSSLQLIALSTSILILVSSLERLSDIKASSLLKAVGALGILFLELAIFLNMVDKSRLRPSSALGLIAVGAAIKIMVDAISEIANIHHRQLIKGLGTIGVILLQISIFSAMVNGGSLILAGIGLIGIAGAINALVGPLKEFGSMTKKQLIKGMLALASTLVIVAGAALVMNGTIGGSIAMMIMATALNSLIKPIVTLSKMTWGQIGKGFGALAGGMVLVAAASALLTPAIAPMIGFGVALLAMGLAMTAAGAGVALFGIGLTTLATMTATSVAAIVGALAILIAGLMTLIDDIVRFVIDLTTTLLEGLGSILPLIANTVGDIIVAILDMLITYLPQFIEKGTELVLKINEGIGEAAPKLIDSGMNLMIDLVNGLADALEKNGSKVTEAFKRLMGEVLILFLNTGLEVIMALFGWIPGVQEAATAIGIAGEKYIRDNFGAKEVGQEKGKEYATGLDGTKGNARDSGKALAEAGKDAAAAIKMDGVGKDFGKGFAIGISNSIGNVRTAASAIARAASNMVKRRLEIQSPSRVAFADGGWFGEGFALGILDMLGTVKNNAKTLADTALDSLNEFIGGFSMSGFDNEIHFKAILDYEGFDPNGFGNRGTIPIDTRFTNGLLSSLGIRRQNGSINNDNIDDLIKAIESNSSDDNVVELLEEIVEGVKSGQVISMDGRIVGSVIEPYIRDIQDRNLIKKNRARGVFT